MNSVDVERITNEITAAVPTILDTTIGELLEPIDSHQNKLFKIVMRKQLHRCNSRCQQRTNENHCNMDFHSSPTLRKKQPTTLKQKYRNTTNQNTKIAMLSLTMQPCYWCKAHI